MFAYVVLGAGFFTTQKAQQTVYNAVGQTTSTLELMGNVYGVAPGATGSPSDSIQYVNFSVGLAGGSSTVDISKMVIVYSNETQEVTLANVTSWDPVIQEPDPNSYSWAVTQIQNSPTSSVSAMLQPNEQITISCNVRGIPANDQFTLEIRPAVGAAFSITRTLSPASVTASNILM